MTAARALGFRAPSAETIRSLENMLQSETIMAVRIACAKTAIDWLKQSPDARALVTWIAQNEEADEVRRAARAALAS